MPRHEEQRVLPYPREFLFDIIADVSAYPDYLPWCLGARVHSNKENLFLADIVIGFGVIREGWTSEVKLEKPDRITSTLVMGPFSHLYNEWIFMPHAEGTLINVIVEYEFKTRIFEKLLGPLFDEANHKMIKAFDERAKSLAKAKRV